MTSRSGNTKHAGKHSVAVSVRIRPDGSDVTPCRGGGIACGGHVFGYPANVLEGSNQAVASSALVGGLVRKFCDGFSCTLMAYGQTGSGKTHTMFGPPGSLTEASLHQAGADGVPELWGVFPRAMMELLGAPELAGATFHASAIEVYMEHAYDLLDCRKPVKVGSVKASGRGTLVVADFGKAPVYSGYTVIVGGLHPASCTCRPCFARQAAEASAKQKAKGMASGEGAAVAHRKSRVPPLSAAPKLKQAATSTAAEGGGRGGAGGGGGAENSEQFGTEGEALWPVRTPADVAKLARLVESERVAHGHALNARSSRSHCLIRLHCVHVKEGRSQKRLFMFVDLAGSERISKTEVTGARQKEASNINQSLTTLGRVVKELNEHKAHVSYRDSALTMLLRASFGGPSCTGVVINVSGAPDHAEETVCSLRFGEKLASVKTSAAAAEATDVAADAKRVGAALEAARARLGEFELAGYGDHINPKAPSSEQTSLRNNIATLTERAHEVRALKARLVEAKARRTGGEKGDIAALATRLEAAQFAHSNIHDIVERQKTIPGLWVAASAPFVRTKMQVASLAGQMDMLTVPGG
eukprot:CAMPEP_0118930892 /NCGR_PEP_ID=MMETSP1169-20130426/7426_1 /TAXON_ID=36882 /ORGANISM="Pyramimonas obovata, Strain CCMP722" /LENGTH=584 /DNA_ID=CAMNT_0006873319 /DNA_START=966 /DNA_END=2720 /DNA_ORIENTATION=+